MPKVFITNKGAHDYADAARFGDIVFITEKKINAFDVGKMYREVDEKMEGSSMEDYIVPSGPRISDGILMSYFAQKHGRINLLLFYNGKYMKRTVVFDQ